MKSTSILQFSDIHFGVEDRDAMAAVHSFAQSLTPDLTLICGDITQSGKTSEFKDAQNWIRKFPGPKLITPGNHDVPVFNPLHRLFSPFARYNKYIAPLSENIFADNNIIIAPYNTARGIQAKLDWSLGVVDLDALSNTIKALHDAKPETLKMVAVHHPLIYPEISPLQRDTKNGEAAVQLLSDTNVDAVLSGHVHAPFVIPRAPGKTKLLSIGSGTLSTRKRGRAPSFNHIVIGDTDINITAIDWEDGKFIAKAPWVRSRASLRPPVACASTP